MSTTDLSKTFYTTLYKLWQNEKENTELQSLNRNFFQDLSLYVKEVREELQSLVETSWKAHFLSEEQDRIKILLTDLMITRFYKMLEAVKEGHELAYDRVTTEEEYSYNALALTWKHIKSVIDDVLRGRPPKVESKLVLEKPKRLLVRFKQAIPAIVGLDMKTYGPFKVEDIAYLPAENAEVLIKSGKVIEV